MGWLINAVMAGITAFAATNLDDILVLMVFFTQVNEQFRPRHIVVGQYLGFMVLLLASLPGFLGGMVLPKAWIGLLGLVPIAIGCKHLWDWNQAEPTIQMVSADASMPAKAVPNAGFAHLLHPRTYTVAAVTVANGGDNIGIYVPLFASSALPSLMTIVGVFFILIGVWCAIAYFLTRHPRTAPLITHYGQRVVPFVLMGLGLYILIENGSYRLLTQFTE